MAWNLFAHKRQSTRERFAGPLAIGGLAGVGLLLLVVLYPEKSLLKLLSAPEVSSPAQQRYLEALVQLRNGDTELVIPLVRSYLDAGCTDKAARALGYQQGSASREQTKAIAILRYQLRQQQLEFMLTDEPGWEEARQRYADQVELLRQAGASPRELGQYLVDASRLGDQKTVKRIEQLLGTAAETGTDAASSEAVARIALGKGDYRGAAATYFKAMQNAPSQDAKRTFFLSGLRTLQSGNLPHEALDAADRYLGGLKDDRQLLLYLTRLALAANRPDRAQRYIRQALGMTADSPQQVQAP